MATADTIKERTSAVGANSVTPPSRYDPCARNGRATSWDTLHYSSDAADSAAQFNRSVSAMPCDAARRIHAPEQGMADTLPLR